MPKEESKQDGEKTIKELEKELDNKDKIDSDGSKRSSSPEVEEIREVILHAIEEEEMRKAENKAKQESDSHIFEKKSLLSEAKNNVTDRLDTFYRGLFSNLKSLKKRTSLSDAKSKEESDKSKDEKKYKSKDKKEVGKEKIKTEKIKEGQKSGRKFKIKQSLLIFSLNLLITLLLLSGLIITLVGVAIYQNSFLSTSTRNEIVNLIPYPAGIVNNHFLSIAEFRADVAALNRFYAVQIESGVFGEIPKSTSVQDIVWERFIQDSLIKDIAADYEIKVEEESINRELQKIIADAGGRENLEKQIAFLYGWSVEKFTDKIVKPYLLREKIAATVFQDGILRSEKKEFALDLLEKIKAEPESFSEYAKKYSQDETSKNLGGDLGFFVEGVVVPEIENTLKDMEEGEVSDLLETNEGFEILKLEEKLTGKDGRLRFRARRILIRYPTFEELLTEKRKQAKIYRFIY